MNDRSKIAQFRAQYRSRLFGICHFPWTLLFLCWSILDRASCTSGCWPWPTCLWSTWTRSGPDTPRALPGHHSRRSCPCSTTRPHFPSWAWIIVFIKMLYAKCKYSAFHVIVLQEQGCCELVLGLIVSPKASMWPQDWAEISFRSETLWNWFYSEPDRGFSKGRISGSGKCSSIYRVSNVQDFFFL